MALLAINANNSIYLIWEFPGSSFLGGRFPGDSLTGDSCPRWLLFGWKLSWVAIVLGGSCSRWHLS